MPGRKRCEGQPGVQAGSRCGGKGGGGVSDEEESAVDNHDLKTAQLGGKKVGTEYYAGFEPVQLTRDELLEPLLLTLFEMEARVDDTCDRLILQDGRLEYTFETAECRSFEEAVRVSIE